jgi:hypothetical protein
MDRQDRNAAETRERGQHVGKPVGAPDQRQSPGAHQQRRRAGDPVRQRLVVAGMREATCRNRRDILSRRIVEGRIHQHMGDTFAREPGARKVLRWSIHVERCDRHPVGETIVRGVAAREFRQRRVHLDQHDLESRHALRQREARSSDPRAEFNRDASQCGIHRGGEQDRVMAEAMPAPRLAQHQPAAKNRVLGGCGDVIRHRDAARDRGPHR